MKNGAKAHGCNGAKVSELIELVLPLSHCAVEPLSLMYSKFKLMNL